LRTFLSCIEHYGIIRKRQKIDAKGQFLANNKSLNEFINKAIIHLYKGGVNLLKNKSLLSINLKFINNEEETRI